MKILNLIIILIVCNGFTQTIKPLEQWNGLMESNTYFKDINNVFNSFTGTWKFVHSNNEITITLLKKNQVKVHDSTWADMLIGEIKYIKEGVEIINTLNNIGLGSSSDNKNFLEGDFIVTDPYFLKCNDCTVNEKRVYLNFIDSSYSNQGGFMVFKKTTENGFDALKTYIENVVPKSQKENTPPLPTSTLPWGWFILIKQP